MILPQTIPVPKALIQSADDSWIAASGEEAYNYLSSFSWVRKITDATIQFGIPSIIAVSSIHITPSRADVDSSFWVITGDLPTAYLVKDDASNAKEAMEVYCQVMEKWYKYVKGEDILDDDVFPVNARPTLENANALETRVAYIRKRIIPLAKASEA